MQLWVETGNSRRDRVRYAGEYCVETIYKEQVNTRNGKVRWKKSPYGTYYLVDLRTGETVTSWYEDNGAF